MDKDDNITQLKKRVDKLERLVSTLLRHHTDTARQLRTLKSAQHQQSLLVSSIQRKG